MENTEGNGGPQVDCFDERESPGMKRELKEIGPQADGGGESEVSEIIRKLKKIILV